MNKRDYASARSSFVQTKETKKTDNPAEEFFDGPSG